MPCNARNPGLEGGTCAFMHDHNRHSFEPPAPEVLPSAETVRTASAMSQAVPEEQVEDPALAEPAPVVQVQADTSPPAGEASAGAPRQDGLYQDARGRWHHANGSFAPAPEA